MRPLTDLTLGKKITILVVLGLVLGIGVFSFLGIRAVNQATEAMLEDRMTTARLVADYLDETLGRALAELKNTARMIGSGQADRGVESLTATLEERYRRLSIYIHDFYLLNEQGQIVWSKSGNSLSKDEDFLSYHGISGAVAMGKTDISGLVSLPLTGTPVVFLISPPGDGQPAGKGALIVAIDLVKSSIGGFIQTIRLGKTGYVEIIDQNGLVVSRTEPGPELASFEKSDHSGHFARLIAAGEPTRGLCHTCHEPVLEVTRRDVLAFVPLDEARWGVVIRQSEEEALAPVRELRQSLLVYGAVLAATAVLLAVVVTRDVLGRIRMLTGASQRIANGDLASPISISKRDEVGILAQTFEDMRVRLRASYQELEKKTTELTSLLSVSEILTSLRDLSDLEAALGSALDKTLEIMKADGGGILLWDEKGQKLRYWVHRGLSRGHVAKTRIRLGEGIIGRVAQTGETATVADISTKPLAAHDKLLAGEGLRGLVVVPLRSKDKVLGVLCIASHETRKFMVSDLGLLAGVARQIMTAIENVRLHREVQRKEEIRGELLQEIISIQEEERRRIARELHDATSQDIVSLTANLEAVAGMLTAGDSQARGVLRKAQSLSISILDGIHKLIYQLRPSLLDDLGLVAATRWLADNNLVAAGIKVNFKITGERIRLSPQLETLLFRVIQEAVYNVARHARARNAAISLRFKKSAIKITIKDDGDGFDVAEALSSTARPRGLGLLGMKERVELARGTLDIRSHSGGGGTEIGIEIPLNQEVSNE